MKKQILIVGVVLLAGLLVACAAAPSYSGVPQAPTIVPAPAPKVIPMPTPTPAPTPMPPGREVVSTSDGGQVPDTERMIVRVGNMQLVVNDVPIAIDEIAKLAEGFGGYVVSSNRWKDGERLAGVITVRVPVERFDDAIRALRGVAVDVTSESTSSQDVTEEYTDLSAKLHNLEAAEEQLLRLLDRAEKIEDILAIQRELTRVRGEIEQTKGRMLYLERTSATSLIEVRLEQANLEVKFTADRATAKTGENVRFYSQIAGGFAPYSYEWDFGDGNTSTSSAPSHVYRSKGSYTVSLKVTDDRGNTDIEPRSEYITVIPGWSAGNIASGARDGLVSFGRALASIFIWLGIFSPVWIVIGGIIYWRRRRKRKKASS